MRHEESKKPSGAQNIAIDRASHQSARVTVTDTGSVDLINDNPRNESFNKSMIDIKNRTNSAHSMTANK